MSWGLEGGMIDCLFSSIRERSSIKNILPSRGNENRFSSWKEYKKVKKREKKKKNF